MEPRTQVCAAAAVICLTTCAALGKVHRPRTPPEGGTDDPFLSTLYM